MQQMFSKCTDVVRPQIEALGLEVQRAKNEREAAVSAAAHAQALQRMAEEGRAEAEVRAAVEAKAADAAKEAHQRAEEALIEVQEAMEASVLVSSCCYRAVIKRTIPRCSSYSWTLFIEP